MRITIALLLLILLACNTEVKTSIKLFDTKAFFTKEISLLNKQKTGVNKHYKFITNSDSIMVIDTVNWEQELRVFVDLDLAKPTNQSIFDVIEVDTNNTKETRYTAIDKSQELQQVIITTDAKKNVKSIEAILTKNNTLYNASKNLRYVTDSGYSVKGYQQLKLGNNNAYQVDATFITK